VSGAPTNAPVTASASVPTDTAMLESGAYNAHNTVGLI